MKPIALSILAVAGVLTGGCNYTDSRADVKEVKPSILIDKIEKSLKLPEGTYGLSEYNRYYYISDNTVRGIFVKSRLSPGKIYNVTEAGLPRIRDGGCGVVNVEYDVLRRAFSKIFCNGVA